MYEFPGLVATLRPKGQRLLPLLPVGDGGLGGPIVRERRAEMADVWWCCWCVGGAAMLGEAGGELLRCIEVGREGEARGIMSLSSDCPAEEKG